MNINRIINALLLTLCAVSLAAAEDARPADSRIRALLVPESESVIASQLAGRLLEVQNKVGSKFVQNDILIRFDCAELNARLKVAEAEQETADVTLKAKQELQKLQSAGETEVALALAAVSKARAQVALQKTLIDSCEIKAPFDGSVVKVLSQPFQSVNQGQALLEIVSSASPIVRMHVPSRWLVWLKPGNQFQIQVDETGRSYNGTVSRISARVDAASQSVELEGEIKGAPALVSGMSGYATFKRHGKQR